MSSTAVLGFIKDIAAGNLKAVQDRLCSKAQPINPNASFADPREQGLSYRLLHKAVEVGNRAIAAALLAAGADVYAADSRGRTPLHWCCAGSGADALSIAGASRPSLNHCRCFLYAHTRSGCLAALLACTKLGQIN